MKTSEIKEKMMEFKTETETHNKILYEIEKELNWISEEKERILKSSQENTRHFLTWEVGTLSMIVNVELMVDNLLKGVLSVIESEKTDELRSKKVIEHCADSLRTIRSQLINHSIDLSGNVGSRLISIGERDAYQRMNKFLLAIMRSCVKNYYFHSETNQCVFLTSPTQMFTFTI